MRCGICDTCSEYLVSRCYLHLDADTTEISGLNDNRILYLSYYSIHGDFRNFVISLPQTTLKTPRQCPFLRASIANLAMNHFLECSSALAKKSSAYRSNAARHEVMIGGRSLFLLVLERFCQRLSSFIKSPVLSKMGSK